MISFIIQVLFSRSSLNHDDVFILDTKDKKFQFNGANSSIQERAKALEVIQFLKEKYHEGKCDVAIIGMRLMLNVPPFRLLSIVRSYDLELDYLGFYLLLLTHSLL